MMGVGSKVVWSGHEGHQVEWMTVGVYTIVDTSDYMMCGMVEVADENGHRFGISADVLRPVSP